MHDDGELTGHGYARPLPPTRLATLTAQAFNADHRVHRVNSTLAASYRADRTIASPHLLMRPV
jgi:hypothetical protein